MKNNIMNLKIPKGNTEIVKSEDKQVSHCMSLMSFTGQNIKIKHKTG